MILFGCPVCFGDVSEPAVRSALIGVGVLLAVVVCVLAGIASVAVSWTRRARRLAAEEGGAAREVDSAQIPAGATRAPQLG
jgi:hypothetical protein